MVQAMEIVWTPPWKAAGERHNIHFGVVLGLVVIMPSSPSERCCFWHRGNRRARTGGEHCWRAFPSVSCSVLVLVTITDGFLQYKEGSWQGGLLDKVRIGCDGSITSQKHPFTSIYSVVFSTVDLSSSFALAQASSRCAHIQISLAWILPNSRLQPGGLCENWLCCSDEKSILFFFPSF